MLFLLVVASLMITGHSLSTVRTACCCCCCCCCCRRRRRCCCCCCCCCWVRWEHSAQESEADKQMNGCKKERKIWFEVHSNICFHVNKFLRYLGTHLNPRLFNDSRNWSFQQTFYDSIIVVNLGLSFCSRVLPPHRLLPAALDQGHQGSPSVNPT